MMEMFTMAEEKTLCPQCMEEVIPKVTRTLEDTDADGARGRWYYWATCPECGADIDSWRE